MLSSLNHVYDFRIFGIFGKYEDYAIRFISNAICKSIFDLPITLRQNRTFDYLDINDLMPILDHFIMHNPIEKSFNITPDNSIELLQIAQLVKTISKKNIEIKVAQDGLGLEYSGDNSLLYHEIKGLEFTPIEKSIEDLYHWYTANKSNLKFDSLLTDK
jgi:GDP-L-fucose synthase